MPSTSVAAQQGQKAKVNKFVKPELTFLLEEDATLGDDDWHIAIDIALPFVVEERNGNVGVSDTVLKRNAEDSGGTCSSTRRRQQGGWKRTTGAVGKNATMNHGCER